MGFYLYQLVILTGYKWDYTYNTLMSGNRCHTRVASLTSKVLWSERCWDDVGPVPVAAADASSGVIQRGSTKKRDWSIT